MEGALMRARRRGRQIFRCRSRRTDAWRSGR